MGVLIFLNREVFLFYSRSTHLTMEFNFNAQELCIQGNNVSISIMEASLHDAGQNLSFEFNVNDVNLRWIFLNNTKDKKYLLLAKFKSLKRLLVFIHLPIKFPFAWCLGHDLGCLARSRSCGKEIWLWQGHDNTSSHSKMHSLSCL